jgi:hypothetical protein
LTPTTGPVGTAVTISITSTSFPLDGDYEVRWSNTATFENSDDIVVLAKGNNPRGSYEIMVNFIVPEAKYGVNYVQLNRYGADDVLNFQFSVKPGLIVDPATVRPGQSIMIMGKGFPMDDEGEIVFDGTSTVIPFTTNDVGSFDATFIVPKTIAGTHKFVANSSLLYADSATANMAVEPFITLTPENPEVGSEVTISGDGFAADSQITIEYDGDAISGAPATDTTGSFAYTFVVTEGDQDEHKIVVTDKAGNTAKYGIGLESNAPPKPSILSPKEKDQVFGFMGEETVDFSWTPVSDPSGVTYTIEVGENLEFFPLKPGMKKTGLTQTSVSMEITPGTYFWRVRATDGAGNDGEWQVSPYFFKVGVISIWFLIGGGVVVIIVFIFLVRAFFRRLRDYYG